MKFERFCNYRTRQIAVKIGVSTRQVRKARQGKPSQGKPSQGDPSQGTNHEV